jgi:SH3 domain protein
VKKSIIPLLIALVAPLAIGSGAAAEETAYVSSDLAISLRKTADPTSATLRGLKSGTRFTIIEGDSGNGFSRIRTEDGAEGWIQSRHISKTPNQLQQQLTEAQATIDKLRAELERAQSAAAAPQAAPELEPGLAPQTAAVPDNSAALAEENSALKARISALESEPQAPEPGDGALNEMSARDWFFTGTGVMLLGIVIGLIIPRLRLRRRSEWGDL